MGVKLVHTAKPNRIGTARGGCTWPSSYFTERRPELSKSLLQSGEQRVDRVGGGVILGQRLTMC
eukprot:scaffold84811_cov75-Phaeocystis_antarctica.AAC.1